MALFNANRRCCLALASWVLLLSIGFRSLLVNAEVVQVKLAAGTIITGRSKSGIDSFNGIPYALPPTGQRRLRPPQKLPNTSASELDATGIAAACPQLLASPADQTLIGQFGSQILDLPLLNRLTGQEDCLTVSVQRPANTSPDAKLPVLFWIYGGGFVFGSTNTYDGSSMINEGVDHNMPFIFVAVNYRLNGFGFLPGAQVLNDGSANLGLLDQRMGLQWVADNIARFGGDPDKVTVWGESAGGHSVFYQMALYGGNATYRGRALFRNAIINSGTGVPAEPIDGPKGQAVYDKVVMKAGCSGTQDTLACLRSLDYETFYNAVTGNFSSAFSYYGAKISFPPRPDGEVLIDSPEEAAATGRYFAVPLIVGNQEDEGTLFSLFQRSIKSDAQLVQYFSDNYFANVSNEQLAEWVSSYSKNDVGSPFRKSSSLAPYPLFHRIAAMIGDQAFILARRQFLRDVSSSHPETPTWSYLSSYAHWLPVLGTMHASDLLQVFYGTPSDYAAKSTRKYYFNFLYNLDPNSDTDIYEHWPLWAENRTLMWFETSSKNNYLTDDFRSEQYDALLNLGSNARQ